MRLLRNSVFFCLSAISAASLSSAATIYSITGPPTGGAQISSISVIGEQWTMSTSFTNINVSVMVGNLTTSGTQTQGEAWITNQIGPGTTNSNVFAYDVFAIPPMPTQTSYSSVNIFNGLTLGPGTYYLILTSNDGSSGWATSTSKVVATGSGVTAGNEWFAPAQNINQAFEPASTFIDFGAGNKLFTITGDPVNRVVPEPSVGLLVLPALAALAWFRNRRS
jgi:hypothetical protein